MGTSNTSTSFAGEGKVAAVSVYAVLGISLCKPEDSEWTELEASRVLLDDEALRIKIEIAPEIQSLGR